MLQELHPFAASLAGAGSPPSGTTIAALPVHPVVIGPIAGGNGCHLAIASLYWLRTAAGKRHLCGWAAAWDATSSDVRYHPICGLKFAEQQGKDAAYAAKVIGQAVESLGATRAAVQKELLECAGFAGGESDNCTFWANIGASDPLGCRHVLQLSQLVFAGDKKKAEDALGALGSRLKATVLGSSGATTPAGRVNPLIAEFSRICPATPLPGQRKQPFLICGPHGAGKTTAARQFGQIGGFDLVVEAHGRAGAEGADFIGGNTPIGDAGRIGWADGPVSQAFRAAAEGKKALLIVDEIYRMPRRERSLFLSALSPARLPNGSFVLRLFTGRAIEPKGGGVPVLEMIEVPHENLSIIATTNVGAEYDVEEDDPAGEDRWWRRHLTISDEEMEKILNSVMKEKGWPSTKMAAKLIRFLKAMRTAAKDGDVRQAPSLRTLVTTCEAAAAPADLPALLKSRIAQWAGLTPEGEINSAQVERVEKAISMAFSS